LRGWGLGLSVWGSGFGVHRGQLPISRADIAPVWFLEYGIWVLGFRFGFWALGVGSWGLGLGVRALSFGLWVEDLVFRVYGSVFRV